MKSKKIFTVLLVSMLFLFVGVNTVMAGTDAEDKELVIADSDGNIKEDTANDNVVDTDTEEASDEDNNGDSFLDEQVNKMDPVVRPYARVIADNIVLFFNFIGAAAILGFGLWSTIEKRRGHTQQAADAKHSATDVAIRLIWALILFNIFVALCRSSTFGI